MTGTDRLRTIEGAGNATLTVRGSRFIGHVTSVSAAGTAETAIEAFGREHSDASHVVSAYRIQDDPVRESQDNAGEPRGTAGPPVLNVLRGEDLLDVAAIVVRYFGGTELGTGGIARAYADAAKGALADAEIVERPPNTPVHVETNYDDSGAVRGILEGSSAQFDAAYGETVTFRVTVPETDASGLCERIMSATSGRARWEPD